MAELHIPLSFRYLSPEKKESICNGCGSKGGVDVFDTMWGLSVTEACNIHDYMWHVSSTVKGLEESNELFWFNMKVLIKRGSWWLRGLRYARAHKYYLAVKWFGTSAYAKERDLT